MTSRSHVRSEDLEVEVRNGEVCFRLGRGRVGSGRLVGVALAVDAVPAIEDGMGALDDPPTHVVDGLPAHLLCRLPRTHTLLFGARLDVGIALVWLDRHDHLVGRADVPEDGAAELRAWLAAEAAQDPPPAAALRRSMELDALAVHRDALVDALADLAARFARAHASGAAHDELRVLRARVDDLRARYAADLQPVAVARTPTDGSVVSVPLDDVGLDGPYWDARRPARATGALPRSCMLLTGAMRLDLDRLERTAHLALPGPGVPFVLPELLRQPGVIAVVATVPVGPHTAYPITYMSQSSASMAAAPDAWGRLDRSVDLAAADFDLRPWILARKLAWIEPGDRSMALRWSVGDCPYVAVPGWRRAQHLEAGRRS